MRPVKREYAAFLKIGDLPCRRSVERLAPQVINTAAMVYIGHALAVRTPANQHIPAHLNRGSYIEQFCLTLSINRKYSQMLGLVWLVRPAGDPFSVRGRDRTNGALIYDRNRRAALNRNFPNRGSRAIRRCLIDDPFAIGRELRPVAFRIFGQLGGIAAVSFCSPYLKHAGAIGMKSDEAIVR